MTEVYPSDPVEVLRYFHERLDRHFQDISLARSALNPPPPVFALEHDLGEADLRLLKSSVRAVVSQAPQAQQKWPSLPFVIYGTEHGYEYAGEEYWPPLEAETPGWQNEHRAWLRDQFVEFADAYNGAKPTGAFATKFANIAWPIAHAILPTYLQRNLAQLLFEFRTSISSTLLDNPGEFGNRLASRAYGYTERFRIFCRNTELLGHVAAALLAGDEEESPYLIRSALERIVGGLSQEQQAHRWLMSARQSASKVRSAGFSRVPSRRRPPTTGRLPRPTDPRLILRLVDGTWNAYAEMPDFTGLQARLPDIYDELSSRRAEVNGMRKRLATGRLAYPGQKVRFDCWPEPGRPFIQLERGRAATNRLIADQCAITPGPRWLFKRQGGDFASEIKRPLLRPTQSYILVGPSGLAAPAVPWLKPVAINISGASAFQIDMPGHLAESDIAVLAEEGLSVLSKVAVRPVGMVPSAWDGAGAAEWVAGEPAIIGIRSELLPTGCLLTAAGESYLIDWPPGQTELFFALEGLDAGSHELSIVLFGEGSQELVSGTFAVNIRDPRGRPEGATAGEGIRLLASPARPTLTELWSGEAGLIVDGPNKSRGELHVSLRDAQDSELVAIHRRVRFPIDEQAWEGLVKGIREERQFELSYDEAEASILTVMRDGIGTASLTCRRAFMPLRWRFKKQRDGDVIATLVDRTRSGDTKVDFFAVESPLLAVPHEPNGVIRLPGRGGLLWAHSDEVEAVALAPTDPNSLLATRLARPVARYTEKSVTEVVRLAKHHRLWEQAQLPSDDFAVHEQRAAMDAITRAIISMVCGASWAGLERRLENANEPAEYLDLMQRLIGPADWQKQLGRVVARNLYKWTSGLALQSGFHHEIAPVLAASGVKGQAAAAQFLLTLANMPGGILDCAEDDRDYFLECVMAAPFMLRAARFAVLGTRILHGCDAT